MDVILNLLTLFGIGLFYLFKGLCYLLIGVGFYAIIEKVFNKKK